MLVRLITEALDGLVLFGKGAGFGNVVAEPGGAAALSALTSGAYKPQIGERVGIIISGGNTSAVNFDQ